MEINSSVRLAFYTSTEGDNFLLLLATVQPCSLGKGQPLCLQIRPISFLGLEASLKSQWPGALWFAGGFTCQAGWFCFLGG